MLVRRRNDHEQLDRLPRDLDGTTGRDQEQVLRRIDRLVFSHAFAEETVLWPVIRKVLREDVRDEEDVLFPRLQEALDPAALRRLGLQWEVARRVSPTRPHPTVSRHPPGNALSGLPLSVRDRSRDLVDAGVQHAPAQLAPAGAAVSRGLATVAGWVERVPLARRGDRPPTSR